MVYACVRDDGSIVNMTLIDPNTTIEVEVEKYNSFMIEKIVSYTVQE